MSQRPTSVLRAVLALWSLVVVGAVATALVVVLRDDLVRAWGNSDPARRRILEQGGLQALEAERTPPAFVPVAITLFVVVASLIWVLTMFFRNGYPWARLVLTGLLVFVALGTLGLAAIRTGPPAVFAVIGVVSLVVEVVALVLLWHRDTSAFLRASEPASAEHV